MGTDPADRDERTLDVVFWLVPVGSALVAVVPLLFALTALLDLDGAAVGTVALVGAAAAATVVGTARRIVAQRRR